MSDEVLKAGELVQVGEHTFFSVPPGMEVTVKPRPKVVCLCGSTRLKQAFIEANFRETMAGKIVLSVGLYSHADAEAYAPTEAEKAALDELYLRKIDMADEVLVLNVKTNCCTDCGKPCKVSDWCNSDCCVSDVAERPYIGESTRREIAYAKAHGKTIRYLNQPGE